MAIPSTSNLRRLRYTVLAVSLWIGHPLPGQPNAAFALPADPTLPPASLGSASWRQLPSYPQPLGVAGILAGTHRGVLIAAGGANFPELPPWEGGRKVYYDDIHVLLPGADRWRAAGRLPKSRAYSAVLSLPDGVLLIGGENAGQVFADTVWLRWNGETVVVSEGPPLPTATTSPVAAVVEQSVYVAAGYGAGSPRLGHAGFWRLDLTRPAGGWEELPVWPGAPRGQAVMAAAGGAIHLFSGLELVPGAETDQAKLTYLLDAYRYRPETGWEKLADMPHAAVAAPTPAPVSANGQRIYLLGGVDNRRVGKQPRDARVPDGILVFDTATATWHEAAGRWPAPVVTTPAVRWNDAWVFVSGEIMAGVRTREVWSWTMPEEAQP
jgi:N-acetylneuraminate epimerase